MQNIGYILNGLYLFQLNDAAKVRIDYCDFKTSPQKTNMNKASVPAHDKTSITVDFNICIGKHQTCSCYHPVNSNNF